jgi:hypothetical protein
VEPSPVILNSIVRNQLELIVAPSPVILNSIVRNQLELINIVASGPEDSF